MRNIRISIAYITILLCMFGVVMVYSSSAIYAADTYGDPFFFIKRHLMILLAGAFLCLAAMSVNCDTIRKYSRHILFISVVLLVMVLIPGVGRAAGGAKRWLDLRIFNIQPSEIAKIVILVYLADYIDRRRHRIDNFIYGFLPPLAVIGCVMALVILEPDLGTTLTIGVIGLTMLFISGARIRHLAAIALSFVPFLYYLVFSVPYRRKRILAFINPWLDAKGTGFQVVQSFIALGSGGAFGVGLGQSKQKLFFLPASHTDFIFSIIGEELGFVGVMAVLILFFALIWQGMRAAFKAEDIFKKMLIFGVMFTIAFEVVVNMGVSSGIMPAKGLPLPFISYGGTSLVMHMLAIGLVLNAARE